MKKFKINTDVIKRRFTSKKNPTAESVDLSGFSKYRSLIPPPYYDSELWAIYEATFKEHAKKFYSESGADKYNHDALDLEIDKRFQDEEQHYYDQMERHFQVLEYIKSGVSQELVVAEEKLKDVEARIEELRQMKSEKQAIYNSKCRKVVQK